MRRALKIAAAAAALLPVAAGAQATGGDSVRVAAGPQYARAPLPRALLGESYRGLWTTPVRVPVLQLGSYAGGLTVTGTGGGNQTLSLRLRGGNGREYAFRLVNKDQTRGQHRDLQESFAGGVVQDQVSSLHPMAALVADPLLAAAGVIYIPPRLYALSRAGLPAEHAATFGGMPGFLEERPRAGNSEVPAIAAAAAVEDTEDFLEALESGPAHRLDTRDYLTGRLVDLFFGDWDRHEDQYSWARYDRGGEQLWRAIPRDRDYVFADYDGLLLDLGRGMLPKAVRFVEDYRGQLFGLTQNAQLLDRRLLGDLDRAAWESVATGLQARLSDEVIERAVARLPAEYGRGHADSMRAMLRARRGTLRGVAMEWYRWMAAEPEVHARDAADLAVVEHAADGSAEVRIHAGGEGVAPYFRRRFVPAETREIRLFLHGGADRAVVRGGPGRITTRVVGGGGADVLADSSRARVRFYDGRGDNTFVRGARTRVDTRAYEPPEYERGAGVSPPRDWGRSSSPFDPYGTWRSRVGVVVGGGPAFKTHGFRRFPFATSGHLRALWAPQHTRFGLEYHGEYHFTGSRRWLETDVRATQIALTDFHGFGNESAEIEEGGVKHVWEKQLLVQPTWHFPLSRRTWLTLAPVGRWTDPEPDGESPARLQDVRGSRSWGALGARTGLLLDRVDDPGFPRLGFRLAADASAFPAAARLDGPFGSAGALARAYLGGRAGPVLALRGGVRAAWGDFPLQEAAFIGGGGSLRGFGGQRFAGDRAVHGSAEVRQPLFRANLGIRGTLGAFGLADAGRVYLDGDSPGGWHTAAGGGLFFHFLDRTVSVAYAHGESGRVYFDMGLPF